MCDALAIRGAEPVIFPTIAVEPVESFGPIDAALEALDTYAWVVFTSANGVRHLLERREAGTAAPWPVGVRIAAVGPATARALEARGLQVDATPAEFRSDAVPAVLDQIAGRRVLLPRADIGRQPILDALAGAGALVHDLTVYRTVPAAPTAHHWAALRRGVDAVTFTSPSTVLNFLALLGAEGRALLAECVVAAIGPITTEAARAEGVRVDVEPEQYTAEGLAEALARHFAPAA